MDRQKINGQSQKVVGGGNKRTGSQSRIEAKAIQDQRGDGADEGSKKYNAKQRHRYHQVQPLVSENNPRNAVHDNGQKKAVKQSHPEYLVESFHESLVHKSRINKALNYQGGGLHH